MHKILAEIQFNIQLYLASWHAMCAASRAIAVGLAKLARYSGGDGFNTDGRDKKKVSSLADMVSEDPHFMAAALQRRGGGSGGLMWAQALTASTERSLN